MYSAMVFVNAATMLVRLSSCGTKMTSADVSAIVDQIDAVVQLRMHEVRVYADPAVPKPPLGVGLNKPCLYTMENVWARDRTTGAFLADAKSVGVFRQQLLRKADKMGARMVDYDHQRGEWTIEVAHF